MKIREFLTEANWGKAEAVHVGGKSCLANALVHCYPSTTDQGAIYEKIRSAIDALVVDWNDAPERTFAEVKALVERLDV